MKRHMANVQLISDEMLRSVAMIIGSASAAEAALAERDRRRAVGEDVVVLWDRDRGILFVVPDPSAEHDGREG